MQEVGCDDVGRMAHSSGGDVTDEAVSEAEDGNTSNISLVDQVSHFGWSASRQILLL